MTRASGDTGPRWSQWKWHSFRPTTLHRLSQIGPHLPSEVRGHAGPQVGLDDGAELLPSPTAPDEAQLFPGEPAKGFWSRKPLQMEVHADGSGDHRGLRTSCERADEAAVGPRGWTPGRRKFS